MYFLLDDASEYLSEFVQHSKRGPGANLFPRNDYVSLADFFEQFRNPESGAHVKPRQGSPAPDPFVVVHSVRPGGLTSTEFRCDADGRERHRRENAEARDIVVLRGYPHLHWLCEVGAA